MLLNEFTDIFENQIKLVVSKSSFKNSSYFPEIEIELHGAGYSGDVMTVEKCINKIFISPDLFYRVITIGLKACDDKKCTIFVGVSGHSPSCLDDTWGGRSGTGPFKIVESTN